MQNINKKRQFALCGALALLAATPSAFAASQDIDPQIKALPNAGQLLQQIERDAIIQPLPVQPKIEESTLEPEDQGPKVVVNQFKFEGNSVLSTEALESALAGLTGKPISITQIKGAVDVIATFYREQGYIATATLPEQDITEGVVTINIVEAIFGEVSVDGEYGKDYKRVRPSVVQRVMQAFASKDAVINQNAVDKALDVMNKMSGFQANATFQAGKKDNTTDVLVSVKDKAMFSGMFMADNTGARSTGRDKQTLVLNLASPFGFGDNINVTGLHAKGVDYANLGYTLPVGGKGLQIGFNSSFLEYNVILKDQGIAVIKPRGRSSVFGVDANYPLYSGKRGGLNIAANYDAKTFVNQSFEEDKNKFLDTSNYKLNLFSVVLSGNYTDSFLAGGVNNTALDIANGKVNMNGSFNDYKGESHKQNDYDTVNTQGRFNRVRWTFNRNQFLSDSWVLSFDATRQWAGRNLDASERLYLGGINGVRAYPTTEGAGSEGYLMKLELRKFLPYNFSASVFVDDGQVKQHVNSMKNNGTGSLLIENEPGEYNLRGYGASLQWNGPFNTTVRAIYATRMGKHPNPVIRQTDDKVTDQDGRLVRHVLWLSGSVAF